MTWHGTRPTHRKNCFSCGHAFDTMATKEPYCCSLRCRLSVSLNLLGEDECWPWSGPRDKDGYGEFWSHRRKYKAHRVAWEIANDRPITPGMLVMHSCDNPPCCNPKHLSLGTIAENTADKVRKGRGIGPRGELAASAKLTEDQVRAIRSDPRPASLVAKDYPVNVQAIYKIRWGIRWKHVA